MRSFIPNLIRGRHFEKVVSSEEQTPISTPSQLDPDNSSTWIDFRTTPIDNLNLEYTNGVEIFQDKERGLWAGGTGSFFGRGVKFPKYKWKREDELPFSFVFTVRGQNPSFLFGIGSSQINVNNLGPQALFAGEIQFFYDNGRFQRFLGGGGVYNWEQNIGQALTFEKDRFYKVTFAKSGKVGSKVFIYEVDSQDFDDDLELLEEIIIERNPANNQELVPYWNAVNSADVFIAALEHY